MPEQEIESAPAHHYGRNTGSRRPAEGRAGAMYSKPAFSQQVDHIPDNILGESSYSGIETLIAEVFLLSSPLTLTAVAE